MIHFDKLSASLRSVTMPYTFVVLLCLLLSSCGLVPNATNSQPTQQQQAMANLQPVNFKTTADEQTPTMPPVQIITFPDMVTPQTLAAVDKLPGGQHFKLKLVVAKKSSSQQDAELEAVEADEADDNEDKDDAEEGDDEDDAFSVQAQKTKPKYTKKDRVFIPETGAFNLTFQAGSDYQVLDGDARDGNAIVQMPREVLAAYMKVRGKFSRDTHKQFPAVTRKLSYADPLYYVKQDLTREKKRHGKQTWLSLGNRALPIPTDWRSADGDKYILKLNNQGVTRVVMRWYPTKGNAVVTYPPGLSLIGPAGGVVELPGIGKLEIPAGAISTPTVVRMSQIKQAPSATIICPKNIRVSEGPPCITGYDFISPILKIEPLGLKLTQLASLYLPVNKQRVGNNHPAYVGVLGNETPDLNKDEWHGWYFGLLPTAKHFMDVTLDDLDDPVGLKTFTNVSMVFPSDVAPDAGAKKYLYPIRTNQGFAIQQAAIPLNFLIDDKSNGADNLTEYLFRAYEYYVSLGLKAPVQWVQEQNSSRFGGQTGIPIIFNEREEIVDGLYIRSGYVQAHYKADKYIGSTLTISRCSSPLNSDVCETPAVIATWAHEFFHAFQESYYFDDSPQANNPQLVGDKIDSAFRQDAWMIESTASYMGAHFVVDVLQPTGIVPNDFSYAGHLQASQKSFPVSLYEKSFEASKYDAAGYFTHLAKTTQGGAATIAAINDVYGRALKDPPLKSYQTRAVTAVNSVISLSNTYEPYAKDAFLKQNLNIFGSDFVLDDITYKKTVSLLAAHTAESPHPEIETVNNLATHFIKLLPGEDLPASAHLNIRLKKLPDSDEPELVRENIFVASNLSLLKSKDYYHPSVIKLKKDSAGKLVPNGPFMSIGVNGIEGGSIAKFGQNDVPAVAIAVVNALGEVTNSFLTDQIQGTLEIYYESPLKLNSLDPNPQETQQTLTLKGVGFDTKTPANNKVIFTTLTSTHELPASGAADDTEGQQRLTVTIPSDAVTGDILVKVRNQETNALFLKVKPHIDSLTPNNVYKGESKTISIKGSGLAARGQVPIGVSFGSTGAGNLQVINSNELTVTVPGTLNDGIFKVKASVDNLLSNEVDFEVLPLKPVAEFVGVDKNPLFANGLEETSIRYKLKGVAPGKTVRLKIQIKPKLGSSGNLFCNACGGYIASTSSYDQIQAAGDITIKYKAPNTNINPTDYLGTQDGVLWKDPRYGNEIDIFFLNTNNEFVKISPNNSDGVDPKVYWNWTATGTLNYPTTIIADNQWVDFAISDVRDKAGRLVPDGTYVYLTDPYYGEFDLSQGTNADDNGPAIRLTGGAGKVRYRHNEPFGWGYDPNLAPGLQQGIQQCLRFQAVRTSSRDNTYAIQPPKDECFYTYRPPQ